ncbi:Tat pathway signal sequence domain protein [Streptomyces sp. NPDC056296]|uniref:Tat pathway signal sequence domain protein n=1 Tax=Streptomyces sp. NPDC056296 TaxID=3345775 RepID=UPI0035D85673
MSGTGPVEPGEGTHERSGPDVPRPSARHPGRLARSYERHRRAVLATAAAVVTLAGGGYLYASRPQPPPPAPPPHPSQAVDLDYLDAVPAPGDDFGFAVRLSVRTGPPVTVTRLDQPYDGISMTSSPAAPFQTKAHSARKIIVTLRVTECAKAPRNLALPFLHVTLRNARAIQAHSYILGTRYAQDLSQALEVACSNESR